MVTMKVEIIMVMDIIVVPLCMALCVSYLVLETILFSKFYYYPYYKMRKLRYFKILVYHQTVSGIDEIIF